MKKNLFITIFLCTQLIFIVAHIHKHNRLIWLTYEVQKNNRKREQCMLKKESLLNELYISKSQQSIQEFARNAGMHTVRLKQLKRLPYDNKTA